MTTAQTILVLLAFFVAGLEFVTTHGKAGPTNWAVLLVCLALLLVIFHA